MLSINLKKEINDVLSMAKDKDKLQLALEKLCNVVTDYSDKLFLLHEGTQLNLLKILALQKDQEVNSAIRDAKIYSNSSKIQSIETKLSCDRDLHKIFITFTCPNEIKQLQSSKNLISDTKLIFKRMDIDVDRMGLMPIRNVNFQHIKLGSGYELTLCVTFCNDKIASLIRKLMFDFNVKLEEEGRLCELRYSERIYWSKEVWKVLRICWELRRVKIIEGVRVNHDGVIVYYKSPEQPDDNLLKKFSEVL